MAVRVRAAAPGDAGRIAALLGELGYPADAAAVAARLARLRGRADDTVLVAEDAGEVHACVALHVMPLLHEDVPLGRITALVVDARRRGEGIGARLLHAAHAWLAASGCASVEVTSGDARERAHRFYEAHGYVRRSQRFVVRLAGASAWPATGASSA